MNAYAAIKAALAQTEYPCVPYTYDGTAKKYITYNYADNRGRDFGDDLPGFNLASVQVHFFTPIRSATNARVNWMEDAWIIRNLLFGHGFTYPEQTVIEETQNNTWHIVFECEYEEEYTEPEEQGET